jgi:hypothetical protein
MDNKYQVIIFTDDNRFVGFARYAGAYRIASELRNAGYTVKVIDFFSRYSEADLVEILKRFVSSKTLFLGFASSLWVRNFNYREYLANSYEAHLKTTFPHSDDVMNRFFDCALDQNPKLRFVFGGSKAEAMNSPRIHHWVVGQGETAALMIADRLKTGSGHELPRVIEGNKLPFADFSSSKIVWTDDDLIFKGECLPIEIARGCIFKCSFCYYPLNGKKKNEFTKSEEALELELLETNQKFGTQTFLFTDDLINDSLDKVRMINSLSRKMPFKLEWSGFCRLDMLYTYPEMIDLLFESGLKSVYFGIETFHKSAGLRSGKGLGEDKVKKTLENLKAKWGDQVLINGGFIVGLPGEPIESVLKTFEWLHADNCPIDVPDIGVLNIKARPNLKNLAIYNSRIGESPDSFGISVNPEFWQHEQMNSKEAFRLVDSFYSDPRFLKKKRGAPLTVYPRLKNIGYTFDQVKSVSWGNFGFLEDAKLRTHKLFEDYRTRLLGQNGSP